MKYVFIIRQQAQAVRIHEVALKLMQKLAQANHSLDAVIFTDKASALASADVISEDILRVQENYLSLSGCSGCSLLVCARAMKNLGLDTGSCAKGFTVSGNMEFSLLIAQADRVIEL